MTEETNKPKTTTSKAKARKARVKKATESKAEKVEAVEEEAVESYEEHNGDSEFTEEAGGDYKAESTNRSSGESQQRVYEGEAEVLGAEEMSSDSSADPSNWHGAWPVIPH